MHIILYPDGSPLAIPEEILLCFKNEPARVFETFSKFSEGEQNSYIKWIYEAKKEETKAERIAVMMERVARGLKFGD